MLAQKRQELILKATRADGAVAFGQLRELIAASEITIRRDIDALVEQGLVSKVHGGVIANDFKLATELPFETTSNVAVAAKQKIAAASKNLVQPGDAIALMGGSSVYELAKLLTEIDGLTVVTNSIPVSDLFHQMQNSSQTVLLSGGIRTPTDSLIGNIAVETFHKFNFDQVFMGAAGVDELAGFTSPNLLEAETNKAVIEKSKRVNLLVDSSKFGHRGFASFARLEEISTVITEKKVSKTLSSKIKDLIVAGS